MSYIQKGDILDYTAGGSAVPAGGVVVIGSLVAVAPRPIAANSMGAVAIDGVYAIPCTTGATGAQGSAILWNAGTSLAETATGVAAGKLAKARAAADVEVHVILNK